MKIDLTDPTQFTLENVRLLIESKDDSENRQLRVSNDGIAELSDNYGNLNLNNVKFWFETWNPGNDYCGPKAAADSSYVDEVYNDLQCAWEKNLSGYIDYHPSWDK
jgi:hypothetical protein